MTLTHQDQRELNRKARAHGLPDLWPEAEELAKLFHHQMRESYEKALYFATTARSGGWPGLAFFAVDPASQGSGMGVRQGGVEGPPPTQPQPPPPSGWSFEIGPQPREAFPGSGGFPPWLAPAPPWMTETAAEAVERFRREGGLTRPTPRKGFLHWLFG